MQPRTDPAFFMPYGFLPNSRAVGLVGRRSEYSRDQARQKLGFEQDKQYVLFSFGAYGLDIRKFNFDSLPAKHDSCLYRKATNYSKNQM